MLCSAKVMRSSLCRRVRRNSVLGTGARAAVLSLAAVLSMLTPTSAGAHRTTDLQSSISTAGPLQESATGPASESSPGSAASTTGETQRQARHSRQGARARTGCSVNLEATPSRTAPTSPLNLTGTLSCPDGASAAEGASESEGAGAAAGASAAGQAVTLYQKIAGTPGFDSVATTTTEAGGAFQFALPAPELNSVFYVRSGGAKSARTRVEIAGPQVVIDAPANGAQLTLGAWRAADSDGADSRAVTITGTVSPADPGATAALEREYGPGKWHRIGVGTVDAEGGFSIPHTFRRRGEKTIRVVVSFNGLHIKSISAPVTYQISRQHRDA
jgi:hypothetical protein